jgi:hypothetical protein
VADAYADAMKYAVLTRFQLADVVAAVGFKRSMEIRRELQVVLAKAAQKGPLAARLPVEAQGDIIQRTAWIEKWCRTYFIYHRMKALAVAEGGKSHLERKRIARAEWENEIIPKWSY